MRVFVGKDKRQQVTTDTELNLQSATDGIKPKVMHMGFIYQEISSFSTHQNTRI